MYIKLLQPAKKVRLPQWQKVAVSSSVVAALVCFSGCATKPTYHPNNTPTISKNQVGVPNYYHVQQGDTVSAIAARYGLNYRQIGALNNLDRRYTIYTGQWLKLWTDTTTNNQRSYNQYGQQSGYQAATTGVQSNERGRFDRTSPATRSNPYPSAASVVEPVPATTYRLPSSNPVIKQYNANQGILGMWFGGREGDTVVASNAGTVLYAGDGLPEYGNLIMIRHDKQYVTAYAHNSKILVNEGDQVQAGQPIAIMGNTGNSNQVALEFQVRENGSPIDPKKVLKH
ncbi:peptidoglycan DD-metalloendopeptidase family protein [Psychrobacter sp. I-STPA10]|uniref:peptidoglycan DD-metalloendopeptidase family protein n=1 Tax=Psychrobacter sp. I-STPA10 TaxID=2585769 RepID=UPI001E3334F0|nr:M23 family metallopeptidase [Psychrobacter sp. I-STPA10]